MSFSPHGQQLWKGLAKSGRKKFETERIRGDNSHLEFPCKALQDRLLFPSTSKARQHIVQLERHYD